MFPDETFGLNLITVKVTAEDGISTQEYVVSITRGDADGFAQQAYLKVSNAERGDFFGYSVAISGDTLVVGGMFKDSSATGGEADNSALNAGAAYIWQ